MIAPLYIDNIWKITWDFFGNFQTLWPSEIQKSWECMERGNTVYSIPIRFLRTGKFIVTDCSLESRKIHMEKVCLVPSEQLRWRVVASCTVSIDIHRATPTFAQTIATIQTLFLDPWKSYQVCWKLKDTTHREIGGSAVFLLFTTFNSWALNFTHSNSISIHWKIDSTQFSFIFLKSWFWKRVKIQVKNTLIKKPE